jgi:hypothetical protein
MGILGSRDTPHVRVLYFLIPGHNFSICNILTRKNAQPISVYGLTDFLPYK